MDKTLNPEGKTLLSIIRPCNKETKVSWEGNNLGQLTLVRVRGVLNQIKMINFATNYYSSEFCHYKENGDFLSFHSPPTSQISS